MIQNGSEWYWNLNLHRNQLVLNNAMAVNCTKLPISAAMYTSAVLTDRGICVGMRNVNLEGATIQSYPSKNPNIPSCCTNSKNNIVSQRNNQTWTAAYDRMRFSALTDPSMATQVDSQYFENLHSYAKCDDHVIYPGVEEAVHKNVSTSFNTVHSISAEFNPFHLFGDKSRLSAINLKNGEIHIRPAFICADIGGNLKREISMPTVLNQMLESDLNYSYPVECEKLYNCIQMNSCPSFCHNMAKSAISSGLNSPTSYLTCTLSTTPYRRTNTNSSRSNHVVVAPKKKWIRHYMRSNPNL